MRALLWVVLLVSGLWSGYWFVGATAVERSVEAIFASDNGLELSRDSLSVQGFPNRFDLTIGAPSAYDPAKGIGWSAPFLQIFSMTWKPWHLIVALASQQTITLPEESLNLTSARMMASLMLHPGVDLRLNEATLEAENPALASDHGWAISASKAVLASREDPSRKNSHRIGLEVTQLALDPQLATRMAAAGLPMTIQDLHLDSFASFSAPIDRHASQTQPKLTAIELQDSRMIWGDLQISLDGSVTAGPDGRAEGALTFHVTNWRRLPPAMAALGLITADFAPNLTRGLEVMASAGSNPDVLDLVLKSANGRVSLGPFPLGPAPRFP